MKCFAYYDNEAASQFGSMKGSELFFTFLFPTLLFVRFGVYFYTSRATTRLSWSMAICSIIISVIIVIIAAIYRQAIQDFKPTCFAVILLPEILLNIILVSMRLSPQFCSLWTEFFPWPSCWWRAAFGSWLLRKHLLLSMTASINRKINSM
jgi:hypothetical protein